MKGKYIHYGSDTYNKNKLIDTVAKSDMYRFPSKLVGLWACKTDSDEWRQWCIYERYNLPALEKSFTFDLKEESKIFNVKKYDDISDYTIPINDFSFSKSFGIIDVDKLKSEGYDGIELDQNENYYDLHFNTLFNLWDVSSIVIWNADIIINVNK